jgi:hypothetical protein
MTRDILSDEMLARAEILCRAARERGAGIFSGYDGSEGTAGMLRAVGPQRRHNFGRSDEDREPGAER